MALIPLAWLAVGDTRGREWWWIAGAFGIAWLADMAGHWVDPWLIGTVYPVSQAAIIGAVLLDRDEARGFVIAVALIGLATVAAFGIGPDLFLRTVAWGGIVGIVWAKPLGRLRIALLVEFGLGLAAWYSYVLMPSWGGWGLYQVIRALGIGLFCWASLQPAPRLRLVVR